MKTENPKGCMYGILKLLNDISAIGKGKAGKRVGRRTTGKISGRINRKLWK
ncbi:MAG: hypothetical protein ACLFUW_04820 [Bacteroidales bacterium]